MKVFVLGHRGMLGHVVSRYLTEQGHEVRHSSSRYAGTPADPLVEEVRESGCDWVVNAAGKIWQKCENPVELFLANAFLPLHLKLRLKPSQRLLHASTDCVFSGKSGNYKVDAAPDAEDSYGVSKILGEKIAEADRAIVLRVSIIGPELKDHSGLMEWFLNQTAGVSGYTNHKWNGITTLEWAKICDEIVRGELRPGKPLVQAGTATPVSKFELLQMIGKIWEHSIPITPKAPEPVDRTLVPTLMRGSLGGQLEELRRWYYRADRG